MRCLKYFCIFLFFLVCVSFVFSSTASVNSSYEPSTYYTDSKEIYVKFNISNLLEDSNYNFVVLSYPSSYYNIIINESMCESDFCEEFDPNSHTYNIKLGKTNGWLKYKLSLTQNEGANEEIQYDLLNLDGYSQIGGAKSIPFSPQENPLSFSVSIMDFNTGNESTSLPKSNIGKIILSDLEDNDDDLGEDYIGCSYKITKKGQTAVLKSSTSNYVTESYANKNWDQFTSSELGDVGEYTLTVKCCDRTDCATFKEETIDFEYQDSLPEITSISISPTKIYPDKTEITCLAVAKDPDDSDVTPDITYEWYLDNVKKTVSTSTPNKFNCATNDCVSGDEIKCVAKATVGGSESQDEEAKVVVSSYYKTLEIDGPSIVQKGQETTFKSVIDYDGSGTTKYSWDIDASEKTTKDIKYKFTSKGDYTITLSVNDGKGSTENVEKEITVVDPQIIIDIKSPSLNQDVDRGENITVKAQVNDNTGTPINNATVKANVVGGNIKTSLVTLTKVSSSEGLYEGIIQIPYIVPENSTIEVEASYDKSGVNISSKDSVAVYVSPVILKPIFIFDTEYDESDSSKISVGNTINKLTVCFELPDKTFDVNLISTAKVIFESDSTKEYIMQEDNGCYIVEPNYVIPNIDYFVIKFKDAKSTFGNYVNSSYKSTIDVISLPDAFDISIVEPIDNEINYKQKVNVKVKYDLKQGIDKDELTDLRGVIFYKNQKISLEKDSNNSNLFVGEFLPDQDSIIEFRVKIEGKYKGGLVAKEVNKTLTATNNLKITLVNPSLDGVLSQSDFIIFEIRYADGTIYDQNTINVMLNDSNIALSKISEGEFAGFFGSDYETNLFKKISYNLKGVDNSGNTLSFSKDIPTLSYKFPILFYYLFGGILIIVFILAIVLMIVTKRQRQIEGKLHVKTLEELEQEKQVYENMLTELKRNLFKRMITEEQFKIQKLEVEQKLTYVNGKIKTIRDSQNSNDLDKNKAVKELINYFTQNNWDEDKIRKYLEQGNVPENVANYIIKVVSEYKK